MMNMDSSTNVDQMFLPPMKFLSWKIKCFIFHLRSFLSSKTNWWSFSYDIQLSPVLRVDPLLTMYLIT